MKKFFGIILIIISSLTILLSLLLLTQGADVAIISTIILFIPGVVVLVTGIKLCARPKARMQSDQYYEYYDREEEYYEDEYYEDDYDEPQEPVSVNCSGCGAKVKVYPNLAADCDYCGTTMRIS
ncbi:hypothetical protein HNR77_004167 [Paenibacillus sp. JGP012]|uniref:Zinc ribbon domain-containing protein n=1 Tax=Paenibacillus silvae TaxID=1325358 RepID=A0ABQ1YWR1_9BACL|nr:MULTISPECIES: hypothetical protein [Paenibacillus]MBB6023067.1 hypothetical protein [Paenibacillus sp. JGP012]MBU5352266.1 hypothetical protein [Paenibacillus barcinonensis]GGH41700.1 hypothetical protein GCM10008014_01380 [Paenibacillus silvae]